MELPDRKAPIRIQVHHILVQHKHEAEDIQKKLDAGASFNEMAKKFSTCPSASDGGDLGIVNPNRLDPDFREELEAMKPGETSGPVRTRFGYHIILRGP